MGSSVKVVLLAIIYVLCANESGATSENVVASQLVQTNSGAVRGKVLQTLRHKLTYYSFKGIPYAKVPTGDLRFKVSANRKLKKKKHLRIENRMNYEFLDIRYFYHTSQFYCNEFFFKIRREKCACIIVFLSSGE